MSETGEPPEERHDVIPPPPPPPEWAAPPPARPTPSPVQHPAPDPTAAIPTSAVPYALPPEMVLRPAPSRPSNATSIAWILVTMALLLAATVGSYVYAHHESKSSSSTVQAVGGNNSGGGNGAGSGPTAPGGRATQPGRATSSAPDPYATPTPPPLDMGAVKRTMEAYLNAVQNHDLAATRSIVCPKFRQLSRHLLASGLRVQRLERPLPRSSPWHELCLRGGDPGPARHQHRRHEGQRDTLLVRRTRCRQLLRLRVPQ